MKPSQTLTHPHTNLENIWRHYLWYFFSVHLHFGRFPLDWRMYFSDCDPGADVAKVAFPTFLRSLFLEPIHLELGLRFGPCVFGNAHLFRCSAITLAAIQHSHGKVATISNAKTCQNGLIFCRREILMSQILFV